MSVDCTQQFYILLFTSKIMLFKKKKRMIDLRSLQKRGIVQPPQKDIVVPTNSDGFVELESKQQSNQEFFGFNKPSPNSFSTQADGYNKREVDEKIIGLDNKIYKLEQRVELLEKKLGVNTSSNTSGLIGW
jgi:hypothetical protein